MPEIVICGGGHLGHALAAVASASGEVGVLTSRPEAWSGPVVATCGDVLAIGAPALVTSNPRAAVDGARIVLIAVPAHRHAAALAAIAPFIGRAVWVGAMPATGLFHRRASRALQRRSRIFGTCESPYNCRIVEHGRHVDVLGVVPRLGVAALDPGETPEAALLLEQVFALPTIMLSHWLAISLRPLNIAMHPARLFSLFRHWDGSRTYDRKPRFYQEWDAAASAVYLACSDELEVLAGSLSSFDLRDLDAVPARYGTRDPDRLADRIRRLSGLSGIDTPMVRHGSGYVPDFGCRFIREDVNIGLATARRIAACSRVGLPTIAHIIAWARRLTPSRHRMPGTPTAP
jgi:hypothetical protein